MTAHAVLTVLSDSDLADVGGGDNPGMGPYDAPPPPGSSGAPTTGPCYNIWGEAMPTRCPNGYLEA